MADVPYADFLKGKGARDEADGFAVGALNPILYPFQADIVRWALKRGRAAIFADCGMGKSFMQAEWARCIVEHTGGVVLIVAPISVGQQTIEEAARLGVTVVRGYAGDPIQENAPGIWITNYEQLHKFDPPRRSRTASSSTRAAS
jgi:superfamily II DNA or RNA helicase